MKPFKTLCMLVAAAWLAVAPAKAVEVSVEAMSSENTWVLDSKVSGTIDRKVGYFFRNTTSIDYEADNQASAFSLLDLTYPLGKGFDFVAEGQFPNGLPFDPRLGMQYFKGFNNSLTVYALATRNFSENPDIEVDLLLKYAPPINKRTNLLAQWESLLNAGDKQYNFDTQKIRLGMKYKGIGFGAASDITGAWSGEPDYNVGGFILLRIK